MQRHFAVSVFIATAVSAALLSSGCSKNVPRTLPATQPQLQGPAWSLSLKSACTDEVDEACVAKHGFVVSADRKFEVGPGPEGQLQKGEISEEEMKQLEAALNEASSPAIGSGGETCRQTAADAEVPAYHDTLVLTKASRQSTLMRSESAQVCFHSANEESTHRLHAAMRTLAEKYYRLPFPDACADSVDRVHALYPALQSCSADADCTYVDVSYDVIPAASSQYVMTDTCSMVSPLVAGNAVAVSARQGDLVVALEQAQNACGYRMMRSDCVGIVGFDSSAGAPVCAQGLCRMNPSIQLFR